MALYVEEVAGRLRLEELLLAREAADRGMAVHRVSRKPFVRGRLQPATGDIVSGSVNFVRDALRSAGQSMPTQDPYPAALTPWLHRRVWQTTLADALRGPVPVFIRPAVRWKRFPGFVSEGQTPQELYGVSRREAVWCAEPVRFLSEWRCYVVQGAVQFCGLCPNSARVAVDQATITAALHAYNGPYGYAVDFGVLSTGETALIEVNDGFSVGAYDAVPSAVYWAMTAARWQQLLAAPV